MDRTLLKVLILVFTISFFGISRLNAQQLEFWDFKFTDPTTERAMSRIDRLFLEKHPDVELNHVGYFDQEYIPALRTALLAGTGPDIIMLHGGAEFLEFQSYLEPLTHYIEESNLSIRTRSLEASKDDQGVYKALPLTIQGFGWYYNKELFRQAGIDPDAPMGEWESFLNICATLKENGITPIATGNNRPLTTEFIRRSLISAFFTEEEVQNFYTHAQGIRSDRFKIILEFYKGLRNKDYFHEEGLFRPYFNYAIETFSRGEAAMVPGLISDIAHWKTYSDALGGENVGYFPNLRHPKMARPGVQLIQDAGVLICMNKSSKKKNLAFLYIEHLFSDEVQKILIEDLGLLSPLESSNLPVDKYPVLKVIEQAMNNTAQDPEMYLPSVFASDLQYRLDDLLINTEEISVDEYLMKITNELILY